MKGGWRVEAALEDPLRVWEVLRVVQEESEGKSEIAEIVCAVYPTGSTVGGGVERSAEDNANLVAALLNTHAEEAS